jgi:hypothetical protein
MEDFIMTGGKVPSKTGLRQIIHQENHLIGRV